MLKNIIAIAFVTILITVAFVYEPPAKTETVAVAPAVDTTPQTPENTALLGEAFAILKADHVSVGDTPTYNSNPPTSGPHANALPWGFNTSEISDINAVHNLEHGGIWISYKDISAEQIAVLKTIATANSGSVIVSPRAANDSPVAVVSWGRLMQLDTVDIEQINQFITTNKNNSPEPLAR